MEDEDGFKQAVQEAIIRGHIIEMKLLVKTRNNMFDYLASERLEDGSGLR